MKTRIMKGFNLKNKTTKFTLSLIALLSTGTVLYAQEEATNQLTFIDKNFEEIVLLLIALVLLIAFWAIGQTLDGIIKIATLKLTEDQRLTLKDATVKKDKVSFWKKLNQKLTDAVPIVQENDILLDHDYDGIKELDNHLPPWWKWMFYASIAYSIFHIAFFTIGGNGQTQYEKYESSIAKAEIQKKNYLAKMANNVDESNVKFLTDDAHLSAGKMIFSANCVSCHGQLGEGLVGPNLTDEYWIHGGDIASIFKTVKYGIPTKMIAWKDQLLPSQMNEVASYVMSIQGSNPANALPPQGKKHVAVSEEGDQAEGTLSE